MEIALLYARVSSKEQEKEGYSIPAQLKLLNDYGKQNKLSILHQFIDVETAKTSGRIQFAELVKFLKKHKEIKIILVEKTDRLYRNLKDWVTMDDLINEYGIEVHLVKENTILNRGSHSDKKFFHGINVLIAKKYIDTLSEEVKKGLLEKAEQGIYPCRSPAGYVNNKQTHTLEIDPERAEFIKQLFIWYSSGTYSLSLLREKCKQNSFKVRYSQNIISRSDIEKILKNPFYMGCFHFKGKTYQGTHTPIISKELYDRVQEAFKRHDKPSLQRKYFPFTGLLKCVICGCNIVGEIKKGKYIYYHCTGSKGKGHYDYIRQERLDELLANTLKPIQIDLEHYEWIKSVLRENHMRKSENHQKETMRLHQRYDKIEHQLDQMYQDRLDGLIDPEFWQRKSNQLTLEARQIRDQLESLRGENVDFYKDGLPILELSQRAYSLYVRQKPEEKRRLLNVILSNCAYNGGTLYPAYRKPFDIIAEGVKSQNWLGDRDSNPD